MIRVNCAAMPPALVESELFGREKGAFTGAVARRPADSRLPTARTIFLDEVGELSPGVQVKLLRVLEEGEFERSEAQDHQGGRALDRGHQPGPA